MKVETKLQLINSDFILWCKNFIKIMNNENEEVIFIPLPEQKELIDGLTSNKHIIVLKSRQLGITTVVSLFYLWKAITIPKTTYLIASYNEDSTKGIAEKLKQMLYSMPDKYRPKLKRDNEFELKFENQSRIVFKVAGNKDIARGLTLEGVLLSEFGMYDAECQENAISSTDPCLSKNNTSTFVVESTAKQGTTDYFYKLFMNSFRNRSKFQYYFFPWYCDSSKKNYKNEIDIAVQWYKDNNHSRMLASADIDPYFIPFYEKKLVTLKQIVWYLWKRQDMSQEKMFSEYPSLPEEAFSTSLKGLVFPIDKINDRYIYIPDPLTYNEVTPLPNELKPYFSKNLFIYKDIQRNMKYHMGVDIASGTGLDYSTCAIFSNDGEMVAEFYSNKIPLYKFAEIAYQLGKYFNYAQMLIERNYDAGTFAYKMRHEFGYINVVRTKKFTDKGKTFVYGFDTTPTSKVQLIELFKNAFINGDILINSRKLLDEMKSYVMTDKGKMTGKSNNDDMVIAAALAVYSLTNNSVIRR